MPARPHLRKSSTPLSSFLLRVHEETVVHVALRYELVDLASGRSLKFASLAALQRHLREGAAAGTPERGPAKR